MSQTIRIASWNINSVRARIDIVERYLKEEAPDVLCLQETKCPDDQFPSAAFRKAGCEHIAIHGQKGYHGVTAAAASLSGLATMHQHFDLPLPGVLSTPTVPPISSASCLLMTSPSPVPPYLRVVDGSA